MLEVNGICTSDCLLRHKVLSSTIIIATVAANKKLTFRFVL